MFLIDSKDEKESEMIMYEEQLYRRNIVFQTKEDSR